MFCVCDFSSFYLQAGEANLSLYMVPGQSCGKYYLLRKFNNRCTFLYFCTVLVAYLVEKMVLIIII